MRTSRGLVIAMLALWAISTLAENALAQRITYSTRDVIHGVNNPWEMRFGPDGLIYFTERPGWFSKMDPETGERKILLSPRDCVLWHEAGMLGFDFHPRFPDTPYIYIAYVYDTGKRDTAQNIVAAFGLFRYTYYGDTLLERTQLFGPALASYTHNGSRVVIKDDKIYLTTGEVWQFELSQQLDHLNGKIHRINLDGSIPADNPYPGNSVWSLGHRNPQGLVFGPHGELYSSEHGDITDDEVNLIEKGRNYGWPRVHGFCDSSTDEVKCQELDIREPLKVWTPTLAVGDIEYFDRYTIPEWKHSILLATLKDASLHHLKLDSSGTSIVDQQRYELMDGEAEPYGRLRSICQSKDGRIFIGTGNGTHWDVKVDRIFELVRTGIEPSNVALSLPLSGDSVDSRESFLTWLPSFYGASYEVQLSRDTLFSQENVLFDGAAVDSAMRLILLDPLSKYYWRVRETKSAGPWSEIRSFYTRAIDSTIETEPQPGEPPSYKLQIRGRTIVLVAESRGLDVTVEVIDLLGRSHAIRSAQALSKNADLIIGRVEAGAYFVRVTTADSVQTHRLRVR